MTTISRIVHDHHGPLDMVRAACALVAVIVMVDAFVVGAPGLALLAVPFVIAAFRFSHGTAWGSALVGAACALYVLLGANYAIGNGLDAGWGDLLFAYVGTPAAAFALYLTVRQLAHHHN